MAALLLLACGDLRTRTHDAVRLDPTVSDEVRPHDPRFPWPREALPTGVAYSDEGVGARYLRDFIHVRPRTVEGLEQLLRTYPFLLRHEPLDFEDGTGPRTYPASDVTLQLGGEILRHQVDVVLEIDWDEVPDGWGADVGGPFAEFVYDTERAARLVQLVAWLSQYEANKIVSAHPITLAVDGAEAEARSVTVDPSSPEFCPCVDTSTDPFTYRTSGFETVMTDDGPIIVDCAAQAFVSGNNLLTLQQAEVHASWEPWNAEQNLRMWVIPERDFPLHLPGSPLVGSLADLVDSFVPFVDLDGPYISFDDPQLEKWIPPHAHSGSLRGPVRRGPENFCEWPANDQVDRLSYTNSGQWSWDTQTEDESVGVFLYESDEGFCWFIFCVGLSDDPIALFEVQRGETLEQPHTYMADGLSISLLTVDQCVAGSSEYCDGLDNDCDGEVDEADPMVGQACAPDRPVCEPGAWVCGPGGALECTGFTEPSIDLCNGFDDDCNEVVDDDDFRVGAACGSNIGACHSGQIDCTDGILGCVGGEGPSVEVCDNGIDDDCDVSIDEGCPCPAGDTRPCGIDVGACTAGQQVCSAGAWGTCDGHQPTLETCNGVDDNCNGVVDEGLLNACGECGPVPLEVCNGVDDDCDGLVDEDEAGVQYGQQNACGTCGPAPTEVCDDVDNDCDGLVDEGVPNCGLVIHEEHFELNGNNSDIVVVPKPATDTVIPLVLVDQYYTHSDDDFEFDVACSDEGAFYTCSVVTGFGNGGSQVEGRVVAMGAGPNATAEFLGTWQVLNGQCIDAFPVADPSHSFIGLQRYLTGADDDFSFNSEIGVPGSLSACGHGGNGGSQAAGYGARVVPPSATAVFPVNQVVWNDAPELITWSGIGQAYPLLSVSAYETNGDDDASWDINCHPDGADYVCLVSVSDGNSGSHVRVQGFLVEQ
ncbi:MAG: MopE-related protein [Myxococcota bacterium]